MDASGWTDAHAHPQKLGNLTEALNRAAVFGIHRILANSTHPRDWDALRTLCSRHPALIPQFGVHPWEVRDLPDAWAVRLTETLLSCPESGLGEMGLDRKLTQVPLELQIPVFQEQIRIANQLHRPCSLHVVGAWEELHACLKKEWPHRMLLHAYSGSAEQLGAFLGHRVWFSFGGAVIRQSNSERLRAAVRAVPADRLMLETDAPYQHPDGKDRVQEPIGILRIAEAVAELRGIPIDELRRLTQANMEVFLTG